MIVSNLFEESPRTLHSGLVSNHFRFPRNIRNRILAASGASGQHQLPRRCVYIGHAVRRTTPHEE